MQQKMLSNHDAESGRFQRSLILLSDTFLVENGGRAQLHYVIYCLNNKQY
jgi:hypothetical protein